MTEIAEPDRLVELVDGLTAALADLVRRHESTTACRPQVTPS